MKDLKSKPEREIRADFHAESLVVYQAYSPAVAEPALAAQRFVAPFSRGRMTWIKPSFLWMMERSNWAQKPGQERVLAVHIRREGWEEALSLAVLTDADPRVYPSQAAWEAAFAQAKAHVQWDPERTLQGKSLPYRSIQVGISRHLIDRYADEWIVRIEDYTPRAHKMAVLLRSGRESQAKALLPTERPYPLPAEISRRLGMAG